MDPGDPLAGHPLLLPSYRPNAGAVIRSATGALLWCERADYPGSWQFPQGGVDPGESPEQALWRELAEELGLADPRAHLQLERSLAPPVRYAFPREVIARWLDGGRPSHLGQEQHWFLLRFTGDERAITLEPPPGEQREFRAWRWAGPELLAAVPAFKREAARQALAGLGLL